MAKFCKHETFWRQPLKVFVRTRLKCQRAIYLQSSLGVVITTFCSRHKYAAKTCLQIAQQAERWVLHAQLMAPDRQEDCVHVISSSIQCGRMEHSIFGRQWLCMEAKMTPINRPTGLSEAGGGIPRKCSQTNIQTDVLEVTLFQLVGCDHACHRTSKEYFFITGCDQWAEGSGRPPRCRDFLWWRWRWLRYGEWHHNLGIN